MLHLPANIVGKSPPAEAARGHATLAEYFALPFLYARERILVAQHELTSPFDRISETLKEKNAHPPKGKSGELASRVEQLASIIESKVRIFGSEHPDVALSRLFLGRLCFQKYAALDCASSSLEEGLRQFDAVRRYVATREVEGRLIDYFPGYGEFARACRHEIRSGKELPHTVMDFMLQDEAVRAGRSGTLFPNRSRSIDSLITLRSLVPPDSILIANYSVGVAEDLIHGQFCRLRAAAEALSRMGTAETFSRYPASAVGKHYREQFAGNHAIVNGYTEFRDPSRQRIEAILGEALSIFESHADSNSVTAKWGRALLGFCALFDGRFGDACNIVAREVRTLGDCGLRENIRCMSTVLRNASLGFEHAEERAGAIACARISLALVAAECGEFSFASAEANMELGHRLRNASGLTKIQLECNAIIPLSLDWLIDPALIDEAEQCFTAANEIYCASAHELGAEHVQHLLRMSALEMESIGRFKALWYAREAQAPRNRSETQVDLALEANSIHPQRLEPTEDTDRLL